MRRYLSLRALGLLAVALVLIGAMIALGLWQLGAYDAQQRDDAAAAARQAPMPLDEALGPDAGLDDSSVGRPVIATGSYLADEQLYIRGYPGAQAGFAVVTPLLTDSGSAVLVLRGAADAPRASVPAGSVTVDGILQPSQETGLGIDADRVTDGVRIASLVKEVDPDLYSGYIILRTSDPAEQLSPVVPPSVDPSAWAGIRNLLYAIQWWFFAGFVAFMWWRIVNDADSTTPQPVG